MLSTERPKSNIRESFNRGEQLAGSNVAVANKEEGGKSVSILNDIRERYSGTQEMNRYSGQGKYKYEHGTYEGEFLAGKFHGEGKLYVRGGYWTGIWEEGNLKFAKKFVFDDELDHKGPNEVEWPYCSATDPRFYREITEGMFVCVLTLVYFLIVCNPSSLISSYTHESLVNICTLTSVLIVQLSLSNQIPHFTIILMLF